MLLIIVYHYSRRRRVCPD